MTNMPIPNNFSVSIYEKRNEIEAFYPVEGTPVFPYSFGQLLDEKLDEAYITIVRDGRKNYRCNTLIRIITHKHGEEELLKDAKYYVVARDNGYEKPIKSGLYTHQLYLIEVTKRLEGIMCQSITFTNTRGRDYTNAAIKSKGEVSDYFEGGGLSVPDGVFVDGYKTPSKANQPFYIKPIQEIFESLIAEYNAKNPQYQVVTSQAFLYYSNLASGIKSGIVVYVDGQETEYTASSQSEWDTFKNTGFYIDPNYASRVIVIYRMFYTAPPVQPGENAGSYVRYDFILVENANPIKPYTLADCVDRVLDLAEPLFLNRATGEKDTPRYKLDPAQKDWLESVQAPEFTMTQCTLREQLRVIGGYIHAEPRLIFNEEARTDENGNEYEANSFYVHFDPFDQEGADIGETPYIYQGYSQDINQYCTKIETNASNITNSLSYAKGVQIMPFGGGYKSLRTESVNVRINETSGIIPTSYPIREIKAVYFAMYNADGGLFWGDNEIDITPYIFERTEYEANLSSYDGVYPKSKAYALYYTQGEKNIGGLFFKANSEKSAAFGSDWLDNYAIVNILSNVLTNGPGTRYLTKEEIRNTILTQAGSSQEGADYSGYPGLCFRVEYVPIYNARFSQEKPYLDPTQTEDFMQVYNQSENVIEALYYGENVKGVAARLGNVERERTYILPSLDIVPKIGDRIDEYKVSAVNTEYKPFYIKSTVALSQKFNRISPFVGVNSTKRVYEVSEREAYARNVLIKEYIMVGSSVQQGAGVIFHDTIALASIFDDKPILNFTTPHKISAVAACSFAKGDVVFANSFGRVLLPVIASAFGNAMVFAWNYKDNYSAGQKSVAVNSGEISGYWGQDVPYGDYYGRAYWYYFHLLNGTDAITADYNTKDSAFGLPSIADIPSITGGNSIATIDHSVTDGRTALPYLLRKDSREALSFSYSVEFVANENDLILGSALARSCYLVSGQDNHPTGTPICVTLNAPLGEFATRVTENMYDEIKQFSVSVNEQSAVTEVDINPTDGKPWAIITPIETVTETYTDDEGKNAAVEREIGGEILIASNTPVTGVFSRQIFLTPTNTLYQ